MTIDEGFRAERAWALIQRKPATLTFEREGSADITQVVRVEYSTGKREKKSDAMGVAATRDVVVFGVRNHPDDSIADTDIERSDVFKHNGQFYQVIDVMYLPGQIQAGAEVYQ